ncbi:RNase H family protein [Planosporangium sp. 12N6]|uniref:RNase H family protein n=1 Tax=Planosporangium spinosum TaxID=3402278 RepID=UPI003CF6EF05
MFDEPTLFDLPTAPAPAPTLTAPAPGRPAAPAPAPVAVVGAPVVAATDGSCEPNPGTAAGAWYVSPTCYGVVPIDGTGTNNIGELAAIRALLRAVPADRPLEIVYDSEYARKCLTEWIGGWSRGGTLPPSAWRRGRTGEPVKNAELIAETHALLAGRTVIWTKAKAHVSVRSGGHALNHEADRLAGAAVATMRQGEVPDRGPGWGE